MKIATGVGTVGLLAWIVFGFLAGAVARVISPDDNVGGSGCSGFVITCVLGIIGAVVGGFVGTILGFGEVTGFNLRSFVVAVLGALIVLYLARVLDRRR